MSCPPEDHLEFIHSVIQFLFNVKSHFSYYLNFASQ
jgi:hypothetical protein